MICYRGSARGPVSVCSSLRIKDITLGKRCKKTSFFTPFSQFELNGVKSGRFLHRLFATGYESSTYTRNAMPVFPLTRYPYRLIHNHIRKTETISDLRFSAPLGARTLDPNIKSVVLYQLS